MIVRFNVCLCVEGDHFHVGFDECVATVVEEEGGETTRSVWIVPVSGWMDKGSQLGGIGRDEKLRGKLKVGWTSVRRVGEDRLPLMICGWEERKDTHLS